MYFCDCILAFYVPSKQYHPYFICPWISYSLFSHSTAFDWIFFSVNLYDVRTLFQYPLSLSMPPAICCLVLFTLCYTKQNIPFSLIFTPHRCAQIKVLPNYKFYWWGRVCCFLKCCLIVSLPKDLVYNKWPM